MRISRRIGSFALDRRVLGAFALAALALAGRAWLHDNPQHNPWAPLNLDDPPGWATQRKLAALRSDPEECLAVLDRSAVTYRSLDPAGEGSCRRADRLVLAASPLAPAQPVATCPVMIGMELWIRSLEPIANEIYASPIARIEHFGTYNCRRINGAESGNWSEHATGNAIDIAAFVTEDGQRVSVLDDWNGGESDARFLRAARDSACGVFGTVLSPDYNAAHADHFHLDQAARGLGGVCR